MLHLPIHSLKYQNDRGFTFLEILAILIVVSILVAIGSPSLIAMQGAAKLNSSLDNLRTALETSQFQAIKTNKSCTVSLPSNASSINGNCLNNGPSVNLAADDSRMTNINNDIIITTKSDWKTTNTQTTPTQVIYNSKGITQSEGTIILSSTATSVKKCLKINAGMGLIRSGKYINNNCEISE